MNNPATLITELEKWTGFPYALFVHSGSAALKLGLSTLLPAHGTIALPGLACWTLTGSIVELGHTPYYLDIDEYLGALADAAHIDLALVVEPWGSPCDWKRATGNATLKLIDLTLSFQGGYSGQKPADYFDGAIISLGRGKPLDIGAGGILLLRERDAWQHAKEALLFGRRQSHWVRHTERYVFSELLFEILLASWLRAKDKRTSQVTLRQTWTNYFASLPLNPAIVRPQSELGYTTLLPLFLDSNFPVSTEDVYAASLAEGIPLGLQPVSPAYLESAVTNLYGNCPNAEALAPLQMFMPTSQLTDENLMNLSQLFDQLVSRPEEFRRPYPVKQFPAPIPDRYVHWRSHAIIGRCMNGTHRLYDPIEGKLYKVSEAVVAALQDVT